MQKLEQRTKSKDNARQELPFKIVFVLTSLLFVLFMQYICAVKLKGYQEFLAVLIMIGLGIVMALNINLPTFNHADKPNQSGTDTFTVKKANPKGEKWADGKSLFKSNCASCHNTKADGTGPALSGVEARWNAAGAYKGKTGKQWLYTWIHNWHDANDAGYRYAVDMANSRPAEMNVFTTLKDEDIDKILLYVENPDINSGPVTMP